MTKEDQEVEDVKEEKKKVAAAVERGAWNLKIRSRFVGRPSEAVDRTAEVSGETEVFGPL